MYCFIRLRNLLLIALLLGGIFALSLVESGEINLAEVIPTLNPNNLLPTPYLTGLEKGVAISADAAILIDSRTGSVLYAKNEHIKRAPASTTKILTGILALEYGDVNQIVTIDKAAVGVGGSQIWLEAGEKRTLLELLQGLMLKSGNDAAVAIAYHIAGSVPGFSALMNQRAKELGALNSEFSNPNGLPEKTKPHHSTAYDLALLARRGLEIPVFQELVRTKYEEIPWGDHDWQRVLKNTNRLLWYFAGADGVKTGTTRAAGNCLVASATRDGFQLIAVVLHSDNRWRDAASLLEYGFSRFRPYLAYPEGQAVKSIPVTNGAQDQVPLITAGEVAAVVPLAQWSQVQTRVTCPEYLTAPFWSGEEIGEVEVILGDQVLASSPLITAEPVGRKTFWQRLFGD